MQFSDVLEAYNRDVLASVRLIEEHYQIGMLEGWRARLIPKEGTVRGARFSFHGIGCRVIRGRRWRDWDFPIVRGKVGIDPWKIWYDTKSAPVRYGRFAELDTVREEVGKLEACGPLKKREHSNQYFWTSES